MKDGLQKELPTKVFSAAIALGSNLSSVYGDREANLREAIRRAPKLGRVVAVSTFYDTEPSATVPQPRFLNATILLETRMEPLEMLRGLLEIERGIGRERQPGIIKGPRVIDLDLLLHGDRVLTTAELTLPHPEMDSRRFVLEPLAEIAPAMVHPVLQRTVLEMLDALAERD